MIASVHIAAPGTRRALRAFGRRPDQAKVPGLQYAETVVAAPLGPGLIPKVTPSKVGLIASWDDDEYLDRFLADPSLAGPFASGWHVRMRPLRLFGAWPRMPGLPKAQLPVDDSEPVVVLTLGRPRVPRFPAFLRASARAEAAALGAPGLLASTGLAHPPRLVSTFSVWRSAAEMRAYAHAAAGDHLATVRADRDRPFHHESAFIRFRPHRSGGLWDGSDPLAGLLRDEEPAV